MSRTPTPTSSKLPAAEIEKKHYLQTAAAAEFLDLSDAYLRLLRARGEGPPYCRLGRRVVYRRADLDAWASRFRVPS